MIKWSRVLDVISLFKKPNQAPDYAIQTQENNEKFNVLDSFANLLQGASPCIALAIRSRDNKIVLATNVKPDEPFTITDYETQCMLEYLEPFSDKNLKNLCEVLVQDKRLKTLPYYNRAKLLIIKLCKELKKQDTEIIADEFDADICVNEPNQVAEFLNNIDIIIQTFDRQLLNGLNIDKPKCIIELFEIFFRDINGNLCKLKECETNLQENMFNRKIAAIKKQLYFMLEKDIKFVRDLIELISNDSNDYISQILKALKNDIEYSPEIQEAALHEFQIDRTGVNHNSLSYHAEHRLAINRDDYFHKYIGISKLCCPICYYIVKNDLGYEVAGTHGNFYYGSALIGLRLHEKPKQVDILKQLFPLLKDEIDGLFSVSIQGHMEEEYMDIE